MTQKKNTQLPSKKDGDTRNLIGLRTDTFEKENEELAEEVSDQPKIDCSGRTVVAEDKPYVLSLPQAKSHFGYSTCR